jgi:hypothetical protein
MDDSRDAGQRVGDLLRDIVSHIGELRGKNPPLWLRCAMDGH